MTVPSAIFLTFLIAVVLAAALASLLHQVAKHSPTYKSDWSAAFILVLLIEVMVVLVVGSIVTIFMSWMSVPW